MVVVTFEEAGFGGSLGRGYRPSVGCVVVGFEGAGFDGAGFEGAGFDVVLSPLIGKPYVYV